MGNDTFVARPEPRDSAPGRRALPAAADVDDVSTRRSALLRGQVSPLSPLIT